jgi:hypothetical protein
MSFNICRCTLGSLAMFTAIRNASSRYSSFAADRGPIVISVDRCYPRWCVPIVSVFRKGSQLGRNLLAPSGGDNCGNGEREQRLLNGLRETEASIANKISHGTFSATFLLPISPTDKSRIAKSSGSTAR